MECRYIGNDNALGLKHNKLYDISLEKSKGYQTYLMKADTILIDYSSVISIKRNWRISDKEIENLLNQ